MGSTLRRPANGPRSRPAWRTSGARPPLVSRRAAEAALRRIRRRYWTIRRVGFAIAYRGLVAFFLLAPWLVVGSVLWRSGLVPLPAGGTGGARLPPRTPAAVQPSSGAAARNVVVTAAQVRGWVQDVLRPYPQLVSPEVRFAAGGITVRLTDAGPPPRPVVVQLVPQARGGRIAVTLAALEVSGLSPPALVDALTRSWLLPMLEQRFSAVVEGRDVTAVEVAGDGLTVWVRP